MQKVVRLCRKSDAILRSVLKTEPAYLSRYSYFVTGLKTKKSELDFWQGKILLSVGCGTDFRAHLAPLPNGYWPVFSWG
jgi:hypothetical protein